MLDPAKQQYLKLTRFAFIAVPLYVLALWLLNIGGAQGAIALIFLCTTMLAVFVGFAPHTLFMVAGLGALAAGLKDNDLITGAKEGLSTWYKVVLNVTFYIQLMTWWLMIFPYENKPFNFFPFAALSLMMFMVMLKWNKGGSVLPWFVILVSAGSMVWLSVSTILDIDSLAELDQKETGPTRLVDGQHVWLEPGKSFEFELVPHATVAFRHHLSCHYLDVNQPGHPQPQYKVTFDKDGWWAQVKNPTSLPITAWITSVRDPKC